MVPFPSSFSVYIYIHISRVPRNLKTTTPMYLSSLTTNTHCFRCLPPSGAFRRLPLKLQLRLLKRVPFPQTFHETWHAPSAESCILICQPLIFSSCQVLRICLNDFRRDLKDHATQGGPSASFHGTNKPSADRLLLQCCALLAYIRLQTS